jgi:hypothetical protein
VQSGIYERERLIVRKFLLRLADISSAFPFSGDYVVYKPTGMR